MTGLPPTDRRGRPFDAYPSRVDERTTLLGLSEGLGVYHDDRGGRVEWCLLRGRDATVDDRTRWYFTPSGERLIGQRAETLRGGRTVGEFVAAHERTGPGFEVLTTYGRAMRRATELAGTGLLTDEQAAAYALRVEGGVGRAESAALLGRPPHAVDEALWRVRRRIDNAADLADELSWGSPA
jgi:hypothetical protein